MFNSSVDLIDLPIIEDKVQVNSTPPRSYILHFLILRTVPNFSKCGPTDQLRKFNSSFSIGWKPSSIKDDL